MTLLLIKKLKHTERSANMQYKIISPQKRTKYKRPYLSSKTQSGLTYIKEMQKLVGGYIECVSLSRYLTLVCNEEGKLLRLPPNRKIAIDYICGPFFITRVKGDDFISLTAEDIA